MYTFSSSQKRSLAIASVIILVLAAIWRGAKEPPQIYTGASDTVTSIALGAPEFAAKESRSLAYDQAAPVTEEADKKIIRRADMQLLVSRVPEAIKELETIAGGNEGFLESSNVYEQYDKTLAGNATLRVSVTKFSSALEAVRALALSVKSESISGQDVTEQYIDLEARLNNMRAEERAYLALLSRAGSVTELLEVQRELSRVRGNIESLEGQIKYLSSQTDYATITVNLSEKPSVVAPTGEFRFFDSIREAAQALVVAFQKVVLGIIWIVIVGGGLLIPIAILVWIIGRVWQRWHP